MLLRSPLPRSSHCVSPCWVIAASRTVVGAILESDNKLVLMPDVGRPNGLALPEVGRTGQSGSASQLHDFLVREGLDATLGFLFAVFENPGTREQCIYYRGEALLHLASRKPNCQPDHHTASSLCTHPPPSLTPR